MRQRILLIMSTILTTVRSQELNSSDFDTMFLDDLSAMVPDPPASRRARGLYGVDTDGLCPPECLCLSEIQVMSAIMMKISWISIIRRFCAIQGTWLCSRPICPMSPRTSASPTRTSRLSPNMWVKSKVCLLRQEFYECTEHVWASVSLKFV